MERQKPVKVIVILGPTSAGKSQVAINLAKQFDGEVISADSRQIFRQMDLGTGKIEGRWGRIPKGQSDDGTTPQAFIADGVPHHLIDIIEPDGEYNIAHFQRDCLKLIGQISRRGRLPIICGGTGFWISAVVDGLRFPQVKPDPQLRQELETLTCLELAMRLEKIDPARAKSIDKKNKVRLVRAIEIATALGKVPPLVKGASSPNPLKKIVHSIIFKGQTLSVAKQKFRAKQLGWPSATTGSDKDNFIIEFLQIGIDQPKEQLDQLIKTRLKQRLQSGMVEEVEKLKKNLALSWKKIQSFGLGYYWIPLFLQGYLTKEEMEEKIFLAERNYSKRQRTWFKRDKRILWTNNYAEVEQVCRNFLSPSIKLRSLFFFW